MIYIIGTLHQIQHRNPAHEYKEKIEEYARFLTKTIEEENILVVAEEASLDSEQFCPFDGKGTQLKIIAQEKGLPHVYCDPGREESKRLGIKRVDDVKGKYGSTHEDHWKIVGEMAQHFCLREKEWLRRIEQYVDKKVLFVCGYDHYESFRILLTENNWDAKLLKIIA